MIAMLMAAAAAFLVDDLRHAVADPLRCARAASASRSATTARSSTRTSPRRGRRRWAASRSSAAVVVGYLVAHVRRGRRHVRDARAGRCSRLIVGLGVVGFVDDYLGVRAAPEPRAAQAGQDARHRRSSRSLFAWLAVNWVHVSTRTCRSRARSTSTSATVGWFVWAIARRLRDRERGEPHRRARRARGRVVGAHVRGVHDHRVHAVPPPGRSTACSRGAGARPRDRRGGDVRRVRGLPLVERRARADLHGRHRLARDRRRDGRARAADAHAAAAADPRRASADRDAVGDRAGHLVPRLPPAGAAHGADPPPLRGRRLVGVHGDRAVLAVRRRSASRSASASSTPTSSGSGSNEPTDARARDRTGRDRRRGRAPLAAPRAGTSS